MDSQSLKVISREGTHAVSGSLYTRKPLPSVEYHGIHVLRARQNRLVFLKVYLLPVNIQQKGAIHVSLAGLPPATNQEIKNTHDALLFPLTL